MADDLILSDDEFDVLRAHLRAAYRRAGQPVPEAVALAAIATADGNAARVYAPVELAEAPEWTPFLPVAGTYQHPAHGALDFSVDTYRRLIANFQSGVYQRQLPVNAEHDPHAAGAVGWITELRLNDDTSVDARVDWNERGRALLEGDRFRYVSAEVLRRWTDPVSGADHRDIAAGMAICTRPYFKESVLRPLAASDAVWTYGPVATGREDAGMTKPEQQAASGTEPTAVNLTEAEVVSLREKAARADELAVQLSEARTQRDAARGELNAIKAEQRVQRFTAEVRGKSDENGKAWPGDVQAHVDTLVSLAEAFGEEGAPFKQYVAVNRAAAERDALTRPVGSAGDSEAQTALDKINARARQMFSEAGGKLTFEQAFVAVMDSDRELAAAYARERK